MARARRRGSTPRCALLTGGAGYIGAHTNKALFEAGWSTVVLDDLSTGHREFVRWGELVEGSVLDSDLLSAVFERYAIDAVVHFAGLTSVAESVRDPQRYEHTNVVGSRTLIDAMHAHGVRTVVFSSSAAVYGHPAGWPISENEPLRPISPYGANKARVERLLGDAHDAWGLDHVSLRYFNAAGADASAEIGEWHSPETHLVPLVLDVAAGARETVAIFGTGYPTPDGTCIRDYIHVSDLADAHVRALEYALGGRSGAFNLGTGGGSSVLEVVEIAREVTGHRIPVRRWAPREGDPAVLVADSGHARAELGWRPRREDLNAVIEDAWRWHQKLQARERTGTTD